MDEKRYQCPPECVALMTLTRAGCGLGKLGQAVLVVLHLRGFQFLLRPFGLLDL